ncbi:ArsR/SmtB family transcription factor [Sphingomonas sp. DT-51]|uniref:ArsR/SmtB family transcription factor n=1 Tax=Sphingomonas sp. DT-51 TaxID=3396165 RepID=UPI003F19F424
MRPLFHPTLEEVRPEAILHALADPQRAAIFAAIMRAGCGQACSAVASVGDRIIPKSSLSNHVKVLREAGLIRSERHGVEVRNHPRWEEVEERFPGLLPAIVNAYAASSPCAGWAEPPEATAARSDGD